MRVACRTLRDSRHSAAFQDQSILPGETVSACVSPLTPASAGWRASRPARTAYAFFGGSVCGSGGRGRFGSVAFASRPTFAVVFGFATTR